MGNSLKEYIKEIRSIPIDNSLSDETVIALMNIHPSIMSMIVVNLLEEEYGSAEIHREAMEGLFAICRERSASNQTLARCSRMTPAMYNILCMPDTVFDDHKHDSCVNRSFRLADDWHEKIKNTRSLNTNARIIEYGVLQSILDAFIYVADEDKETDKDYLYLMHRIEDWISVLDDNGSWNGLSDYEAMRRLNIMIGHSNTNGDNRFDAQIEKALWFYYDRITGSDAVEGQTLFYLYWAVMWGIECHDSQKIDTITNSAIQMLDYPFEVAQDDRLWYMAVLIDRECVRVNNEIKQKMLAYSA